MTNAVRLVNGGSIQVRTGLIQGIGPQGPMGLTGADGPQGPQGPQGDPGPGGTVTQLQARCSISTTNPLAAPTHTQLPFRPVAYDDMDVSYRGPNCHLSSEAAGLRRVQA